MNEEQVPPNGQLQGFLENFPAWGMYVVILHGSFVLSRD